MVGIAVVVGVLGLTVSIISLLLLFYAWATENCQLMMSLYPYFLGGAGLFLVSKDIIDKYLE